MTGFLLVQSSHLQYIANAFAFSFFNSIFINIFMFIIYHFHHIKRFCMWCMIAMKCSSIQTPFATTKISGVIWNILEWFYSSNMETWQNFKVLKHNKYEKDGIFNSLSSHSATCIKNKVNSIGVALYSIEGFFLRSVWTWYLDLF